MKKCLLILKDDSIYKGCGFEADHYQVGELVFNTGMSGYQKVLSGLSCCSQIVVMAYPMVGNCGISQDDFESLDPAVSNFVMKEYCTQPSNFRCNLTLDEFLKLKEIPGIYHVDTCTITRRLRSSGTMHAIMANAGADVDAMVGLLKGTDFLHDQVTRISTQKPFPIPARRKKVVLMNFGAKHGIIRELSRRSCDFVVVPYNISAWAILALHPDGIMLSNGPGGPKDVAGTVEEARELVKHVPVFGTCLGHQLISLTYGASTVKLKFGHRDCNHPVLNLSSEKVEITSRNHGYAVEAESLTNTDLIVTHQTLNDENVKGIRHRRYPVFNIQYRLEAAPRPEDANYLFDQFMKLMGKENV